MDDKTGGFRGGSISHPGRQVTLSLYLATVRSHCSSGVRGSFILPLHYTSVGPVHNAQVCYIPRRSRGGGGGGVGGWGGGGGGGGGGGDN
jgi:hypothetical protein